MSIGTLREKLLQLAKELNHSYVKVKRLLNDVSYPSLSKLVYCYFTHSIILNTTNQSSHLIMGNFHIKNVSNQTLKFPVILLKINSKTEFHFTGKYKSPHQENKAYNFQWERVRLEDIDPTTHYCLKPIQKDHLLPNDQLSFQAFQIIIPTDASITVEGFTYFNQSNDGIPAINTIDISI